MSKTFLYILVVIISFNNLFIEQFIKIPVLFEHFEEHQMRNSKIEVLDFISMHYLGNDIDDNDQDRDMELPFKKINIQSSSFVFIPSPIVNIQISIFNHPIERNSLFKDNLYLNSYLNSLFRPPCA